MVQVPAATSVTVVPDTVQIPVVWELKVTVNPEEAVALTANGAAPRTRAESAPNVIVCEACVTWKLWSTGVAAAYVLLPACDARMVQAPPAISVTVAPDTVHTPVVREPKLTANPELALAMSVNGAAPYV
jgi:hypothetical protein